jgi:hypothetical protein
LTCALFLGVGCGNPCATQGEKVEEALRRARAARADLYAPEPLRQAADSFKRAQDECRRQSSTFYPFRTYRNAQASFDVAQQKAEGALAQARVGEGLAKQEALNSRYEAGMAVNETVVALRRAADRKGDPLARALLDRLDGLRAALAELQRRIDAGEYLSARELGGKIREEAVRLQGDANRRALASPPR